MLDRLMPLISSPWLYVVVFAIVAIDGFIPAMPSDPVVIGLGALTATGSPDLLLLALVVIAGGMTGDRIAYLLGRQAGHRIRNPKLIQARQKAEHALRRFGGPAILVGRFLPYGRTATAMTSGSASLPRGWFRLWSATAGVAWAVYALGLGRLGGETFIESPLLGAAFGMAMGMVVGVTHFVVTKIAARRRPPARVEPPVREPVTSGCPTP
ncbi:DedA family protein [Actinoplanes bogorensis]|uniref:DedA family protein n=1 Tax=Paractinoplanes bogorensis TaxID=1610840 RepID=A0ABS5YNQ9_9ACTN|nr:DedA family protein [Actinoplanes bogorensis]MBU2665094.1 DedA family protein [Actinoplanes bogorensis]